MIVATGNDSQFRHFVEAGGQAMLADDPRFASNPERVTHRELLVPLLQSMVAQKTKQEWISLLEAAGVPCGPINNFQEVFENEQVQARGLKMTLAHPLAGQVPLVRSPMRLSKTPVVEKSAPPLLGEHTREILQKDLGMDDAKIAHLEALGIIGGRRL